MLGTVPMGRSHKPALGFSVEGRSADRCAMSGRGLWRRAGSRRDLSVDGRWPPFSSTAVASFVREEPRFRPGGSSDGTPGAVPPEVVRRHHTAATARWHAGSEGHDSVEGSRLRAGPRRGGHCALRPCAGSLQGEEEKG